MHLRGRRPCACTRPRRQRRARAPVHAARGAARSAGPIALASQPARSLRTRSPRGRRAVQRRGARRRVRRRRRARARGRARTTCTWASTASGAARLAAAGWRATSPRAAPQQQARRRVLAASRPAAGRPAAPRLPRASPERLGRAAGRWSGPSSAPGLATQRVVRGLLAICLPVPRVPPSCMLLPRSRGSCLPALLWHAARVQRARLQHLARRPTAQAAQRTAAGRCAGVSAALFAPGWVAEAARALGAWPAAAERLWSALGDARGAPRPLAASLPFATSFDQGAGARMYLQARPRVARVESRACARPVGH
jgi:hypothetical protein